MKTLLLQLALLSGLSAADGQASTPMTCPKADVVRTFSFGKHWEILDDDTERKLARADIKRFIPKADHFALAVWGKDANGHRHVSCFYQDKEHRELGFRLRKMDASPVRAKQRWYEAGLKAEDLHCSASEESCRFLG